MSKKWDGRYDSTYESREPLSADIERAMTGNYTYETDRGGTVRESRDRIDVYGSSNSSKGHSHDWFNGKTGEHGHHD